MLEQPIGKHFHLVEFCTSQTATRYGIDLSSPPQAIIDSLTLLVRNVLDPLREDFGRPITISSGWRPSALNSLVGGAFRSQHVQGQAADILVPGYTVGQVCSRIKAMGLPFDQLIFEFGSWTHVSYTPGKRRGETLTATRYGSKTSYLPGLPE